MSTFKEILDGGFEAHARALPADGGFTGGRSRSVLRSIHRRRRTRAVVTAGGSVLAVGAVAVGAVALRPAGVAQPGGAPPITNGLFPWCNVSTYPVVNPEALGASIYLGRIYEDLINQVYVYATPDGTHTVLELDADGVAHFTDPNGEDHVFEMDPALRDALIGGYPDTRGVLFSDLGSTGGGGSFNPGGPRGPLLGYEWTTVIPDVVPAGINVEALSEVLTVSLGLGGSGFSPADVPQGAVVETVFRWHDGRQLGVPVPADGAAAAEVSDYTGLASASLRVSNLPDGGVFEITSTYDPSKTWQVACWPYRDGATPAASPSAGATPAASPSGSANPTASLGLLIDGPSVGPTPTPSYVTPLPSSSATSSPSPSPIPTS